VQVHLEGSKAAISKGAQQIAQSGGRNKTMRINSLNVFVKLVTPSQACFALSDAAVELSSRMDAGLAFD
jgi:hypothetical protein